MPRKHQLGPGDIPNATGKFLNELFEETTRAPDAFLSAIDAAIRDDQRIAWLVTADERKHLIDALVSVMLGHRRRDQTSEEDWELMRFLADYIKANQLVMSVPQLELRRAGQPASYRLKGYERLPLHSGLRYDTAHLRRFVELLLAGAHFVVLHGPSAGRRRPRDFYQAFGERFYSWTGKWTGVAAGAALGHSHYGNALTNLRSAYAYPNRWSNLGLSADDKWPLVPILLVDTTASKRSGQYNTFFQLEGWSTSVIGSFATRTAPLVGLELARYALASWFAPAVALPYAAVATAYDFLVAPWPSSNVAKGGIRHGADFTTHNSSKWNISTYGASVYSEKRGTTVFLHGPHTTVRTSASRTMHEYEGAQPPDSNLIC